MPRCMDLREMHVLEQPCGRCGHQKAVHTGGADKGLWSQWAIYNPTWANALGWCQMPGCDCPNAPDTRKEE